MSKLSVSLREYLNLYALSLAYEGKAAKTLSVYLSNLNRFTRFLERHLQREPLLSDLTPDAVVKYIAAMKIGPKYEGQTQQTHL